LKFGKEKILKLIEHSRGYLQIGLRTNDKQIIFKVHRLVAEAFIPNPDNKLEVNHKNRHKNRQQIR
jgi:hypothetical protein